MDEVAQEAELLLRQLDVVVRWAGTLRASAGRACFRARAAAWRTSGDGSEAFRSISGRTASRKPPSPRASAASARTCALSSARAASSSLRARRSSSLPTRSTSSRRTSAAARRRTRAPSPGGRPRPRRRRASRAEACSAGSGRTWTRAGAAARGSPISPSAATAARRTVASSSCEAGEQRRAWPWRCGSGRARWRPRSARSSARPRGPGAAAAPPAGRRWRPGSRRRPGAGCGRGRRSTADQRAHRRHRAHGAQRLHRGEAQLLARVGRGRAAGAAPPPRLRICPSARRVDEAHAWDRGRRAAGQEVARPPASCSLPRESTACWRTRLLSSRSAARSRSGTPGGLDLAQGLDGGAAHRLPRVAGERDERGRGLGVAQQAQRLGGADAHRHVRAGQRLQQQRHHALRRHAREGAHGALLDQLALVAEQLEEQHGRVLVAQAADRGRRPRPAPPARGRG